MNSILYFGSSNSYSTANHRAKAIERLGYKVVICDPDPIRLKRSGFPFAHAFHYHTGYNFMQGALKKWLRNIVLQAGPQDLVWVNGGELFGPECIRILKELGCPVVLYNNDDPTGGRDGNRFNSLKKAFPYYDLCAVLREQNIQEYKNSGSKAVVRVYMSYDEIIHQPFDDESAIPEKYRSDIAFIGTWMRHEKRDEFLLKLLQKGLNVSIWGDHWQKSPHWEKLKPAYRGKALGGRDYVAAMQGSKICIGMLSKGNRDLHTRRSVEVPFAGGLLCAERTKEHMEMYKEGVEAVFWDDAEECAQQCLDLLSNDERRAGIRAAGMAKVRALKVGNENICKIILDTALKGRQS